MWVGIFCGSNKFGSDLFLVQQNFGWKFFWVKQILVRNSFGSNKFWVKKILDQKKLSKKIELKKCGSQKNLADIFFVWKWSKYVWTWIGGWLGWWILNIFFWFGRVTAFSLRRLYNLYFFLDFLVGKKFFFIRQLVYQTVYGLRRLYSSPWLW